MRSLQGEGGAFLNVFDFISKNPAILAAIGQSGKLGANAGSKFLRKKVGELMKGFTKTKTGKKRQRNTAIVNVDGTTGGSFRVGTTKKRKKRKKTLKQKVGALMANMPKHSTKLYRLFNCQTLATAAPNTRIIFDIACFNISDYSDYAGNLTRVDDSTLIDYATEKSSLSMNQFFRYTMKNQKTGNCKVSYVFVICKDDKSTNPTDDIREDLIARGYSPSDITPQLFEAADTTSAEIPTRLDLTGDAYHASVWGGPQFTRDWRKTSPVKSVTTGPGDTMSFAWSRNNFTWKEETIANTAATKVANYTVRLLIMLEGELAHDSTNTGRVCYSPYGFDCEFQRQALVKYYNPKGLRDIIDENSLTTTGVSNPVHADNFVSDVEPSSAT